jgi:hypothetical protein
MEWKHRDSPRPKKFRAYMRKKTKHVSERCVVFAG